MTNKKNFRKAALSTMAFTAAAAVAVPAVSAATVSFPDVTPEKAGVHYDAIQALANEGTITGYADGTFGVYKQIKRSQVASIFARALNLKAPADKAAVLSKYSDVDVDTENSDNIAAVTAAGVFEGSNGSFKQWTDISRQQMASVIVRAFGLDKYEAEKETDIKLSNVDSVHKANVQILANLGITNEVNDFRPLESISRGAFASFVYRTQEFIEKAKQEENKAPAIESVKAVNGKVTVTFDKDVTEVPEGLSVSKDGKDLELGTDAFKAADGKVEVTVPKIEASTEGITEATYAVKLGEVTKEAKVVVPAKLSPAEETGLAVKSVEAINAKQLVIKFNKEVKKDVAAGVINNGKMRNTKITPVLGASPFTTSTAAAELSEDGKTLTITAGGTEKFEGKYSVELNAGIEDVDGNKLGGYSEIITAKDATSPTVTESKQTSANNVRVYFSEPVAALADSGVSFKDAEGKAIAKGESAGEIDFSSINNNDTYIDFNLANIANDKKVTVTFNGLKDMAGNLVTPQPASIVIEKKALGDFAPEITNITQTSAKTFNIKFSEDLDGSLATADATRADESVKVSNPDGAKATKIEKVSASEYKVTTDKNLTGLTTVTVDDAKVIGTKGQTITGDLKKFVTFTEDTAAPKATPKLVVGKDNKEYIELTFDKDVTEGNVTVAGKRVKDFVTTDSISETAAAKYADADNKKVLRVPLTAAALSVEGAEYNLTVSSTAVKSDAGVDMDNVKTNFTRGKDGQAENVNSAVVKNVAVAAHTGTPSAVQDNNKVEVTFTLPAGQKLDGASATDIANYSIDGAEVESVSLAAATTNGSSDETQVATLNLEKDSNTFTGVRNITVKDVKVSGSTKVMKPVTVNSASLNENVAPKIEKAELTGTKEITVTFSEAVTAPAATTKAFDLVVGGSTVANTVTSPADSVAAKKVKFTLGSAVDAKDVAKGIELNVKNTMDIFDAAGNKVSTTGKVNIVTP